MMTTKDVEGPGLEPRTPAADDPGPSTSHAEILADAAHRVVETHRQTQALLREAELNRLRRGH